METRSPSLDARKAYAIGLGICAVVLIAFAAFAAIEPTYAASFGLDAATPSDLKKVGSSLPVIIGRVISAALGLVGVVFLVLMLYAGARWMTARGNAEYAEKAKDTITRAIIGLIIIASAYAITGFVINRLTTAAETPTQETTPTGGEGDDSGFLQETLNELVGIPTAHAQGLGADNLKKTGLGGTSGDDPNRLPVIVGNLVRALISVLGIIFLVLLIYAGFMWMTARGEADKVDKAKSTLIRAVIGLIIIVSAYAITGFIISRLVTAAS